MLFKLSVNNIRKSIRDYAIYFFTLMIAVSVFYVFNAIYGQTAMMKIDSDTRNVVELLRTMLSGVSVFVAGVLGLLIVYASRFLMKRRNREFALYMILGMSKGRISMILLIETLLIGLGSLGVGLIIGIGLSQLMSALVMNLFEADMTEYKFMVSGESVIWTVVNFAIMYLVVMIFNSVSVSRLKLIDLMQSGRKSEQMKLKNPIVCVLIFVLSVIGLGYAYYQVGWKTDNLEESTFIVYIAIGSVATFLIFWSVSGMMLRVIMSMKHVYYKGLNSFTFRQISSKVNTMVLSMTVICLMLFVTICTLSGSFHIRNVLNDNLKSLCPADIQISQETIGSTTNLDLLTDFEKMGVKEEFLSYLDDYTTTKVYGTEDFTFYDFIQEEDKDDIPATVENYWQSIVRISDYNRLMEFYGKDTLSLNDGEYILLCNFNAVKGYQDNSLRKGQTIIVFGHTLSPKYDACQDGFIQFSTSNINMGIFIVPDNAVDETAIMEDYLTGNYAAADKQGKRETETRLHDLYHNEIIQNFHEFAGHEENVYFLWNTKLDIASAVTGLGAIVTFLGLYVGIVFLIACGAILALKELSESVDSIGRYEMLRKIGTDKTDITKSLFQQTGIFFLMPLLLACVHSVFGMKFAMYILEIFGSDGLIKSILLMSVIVLLIYGGYFLITYYCSKNIIKEKR